MAIDFRLLGGVEAFRAGAPVVLGPARPRAVLAALLWDVNNPVSLGELAVRVWGEDPPRQAPGTLHSYFSRLRLALMGDAQIVRRGHGYVLETDRLAVDAHRFRDLAARARDAEQARQVVALLEQALGLWRGEPFAGLDSPWLNEARLALEAEHEVALLDRADLLLELGEHAMLLPELAVRARQQPLNERVAAQLMLALYRSGRQADALIRFQTVKGALAEELGVSPGRSLRALFQAILNEDPALVIPGQREEYIVTPAPPEQTQSDTEGPRAAAVDLAPAGARSPGVVPRQLPAAPRSFVGRRAELDLLTTNLASQASDEDAGSAATVAVLAGPAGVGKTSLALRWAQRHADQFPDGQLFIDLRGFAKVDEKISPYRAIRSLLLALGLPAETIGVEAEALVGMYRTAVAGLRLLLVVDNAADTNDVLPLLPGGGTCAVIITSRNHMTSLVASHNAVLVMVDVFKAREGHELLRSSLGQNRLRAEPDAVDQVLAACGGLPLALSIAAGRAQEHPDFPLASLAAEFDDAASTLNALEVDGGLSVRAVLTSSYRALSNDQAQTFAMLGLASGLDIGLEATASLIGCSYPATRVLLRALERYSLVQQHRPGRFRLHDLVKAFAHEQADVCFQEATSAAAGLRLTCFYLHTLVHAALLLEPDRLPISLDQPPPGCQAHVLSDVHAAVKWFDLETDNIVAAQEIAHRNSWHLMVWQFAWAAGNFYARLGQHREKVASLERALDAARAIGDDDKMLFAHRALTGPHTRMGNHEEALRHGQAALKIADASRSADDKTNALLGLAEIHWRTGNFGLAVAASAQAWERREGQPPRLRVRTCAYHAWYLAVAGQYVEARAAAQIALGLDGQVDGENWRWSILDTLGYIDYQEGNFSSAIDNLKEAALTDSDFERTDTLYLLARSYHALGQTQAASQCLAEALDLYERQNRVEDVSRARKLLDELNQTNGPASD